MHPWRSASLRKKPHGPFILRYIGLRRDSLPHAFRHLDGQVFWSRIDRCFCRWRCNCHNSSLKATILSSSAAYKPLTRMNGFEPSFQSSFSYRHSYDTEFMAQVMTNNIPPMMTGNNRTTVMSAICSPSFPRNFLHILRSCA